MVLKPIPTADEKGFVELGAGITVVDGLVNGFKPHHVADIGIQATIYTVSASIAIAGWVVGGGYFLADLCFQAKYGKSITEYYLD